MPIQTAADSISNSQGSPFGFKNRIINGDMRIDQRNAGASYAQINNAFNLDRWHAYSYANGAVTGKFTVQQTPSTTETGYATRITAGFTNYLAVTSSATTTDVSTNIYGIAHRIEGLNVADLAWGTSTAKTITLSFLVRSSLTGTFGGSVQNNAQDRSYPFSYTISSANTWEQKTITVAGDTSGTWLTTNGVGILINLGLGVGTTFSGTAGTWAGANYYSATGATSVVGTSGATFYITGVQLEKGSQATAFDWRPYGTELQLCKRYYRIAKWRWQGQSPGLGVGQGWTWVFDPEMRTTPSITTSSFTNGSSYTLAGPQGGDSMGMYAVGDGNGTVILNTTANAEL